MNKLFENNDEKEITDIISKLGFITKIKKGEKINTRELFVRDNTDLLQRIIRTFRTLTYEEGETKESTLKFINLVYTETFELIDIYYNNSKILNLLLTSLDETFIGLKSLKETYEYDRLFTTKIEALEKTLRLKMRQYVKEDHKEKKRNDSN